MSRTGLSSTKTGKCFSILSIAPLQRLTLFKLAAADRGVNTSENGGATPKSVTCRYHETVTVLLRRQPFSRGLPHPGEKGRSRKRGRYPALAGSKRKPGKRGAHH